MSQAPSILFRLTLTLLTANAPSGFSLLIVFWLTNTRTTAEFGRSSDTAARTTDAVVLTAYYRDVDPPNWAEYSHNPYMYSPKVEADVGPDKQWVLDVQLANPDEWAMVTATAAPSTQTPNIHCVHAVDGVVVATDAGPRGALCSIRNW